jgi:tetratricopeptide (TPR) repeat protein
MIDEWIEQLKNPDSDQRRQAIIALANTRDPAALPALAAIYRGDPDPALRDMALKAGRYIRQESEKLGTTTPASSAPEKAPQPDVSKRDAELAKFYLDAATNYQTLGDRARAIEHVGKALSLNPGRAQETFVANLILITTGMPVDEALPVLLHPDRREALIARLGGRRPLETKQEHGAGRETATWDNVGVDFLVYWVVVSVSTVAVLLLVLSKIQDMLNSMIMTTPGAVTTDLDTLMSASIITLVVSGIFYGIVYTVSLLIQGGAIHVASTFVLGGSGTLVYLYRRLVPFQTWATFGIAAGFIVLMLFGSVADTYLLMPLVMTAAVIGVAYYTAEIISQVYDFGWFSGCLAMLIAGILLAVLSCGTNALLISLLGGLPSG